MFCGKCGAECKDSAKFCPKCGAPLKSGIPKNDTPTPPVDSEDSAATGAGGWFQHHKKIAWIILIVIVAAVIVIIAVSVARHSSKDADMSLEDHLDLGIRYLDDGEFEEAAEEFNAVLAIEPNMQAYRYLADAYLDLDETDLAGDVYEEAVAYALDTYDQTGDLPQYTEELYDEAIVYEVHAGDVVRLNDLGELIIVLSDADEPTPKDKEKARNAESADTENDDDETQEGSSDGATAAKSAQGEETVDWKELYSDYIINLPDTDYWATVFDTQYSYALIDLDDDEIPELLVQNGDDINDGSYHFAYDMYTRYYLLTVKNGELKEHTSLGKGQNGTFSYIPGSGVFCIDDGSASAENKAYWSYHEYVREMQPSGNIEDIFEGTYEYVTVDKEGDDGRYSLIRTDGEHNPRDATREEYLAALNADYDASQAVTPTMVSSEEILAQLDEY